ncbi:hypothetical protein L915_00592 [Phytophthora nicotianae]|uniref:Uncharacterized protein n=1 Tax=Phytophthora nicotianae TaxID=4792 RepID=W2HQN0_PHYNI|nr:hypothetical protein L915_00592 [Phytophthora nicotianae]
MVPGEIAATIEVQMLGEDGELVVTDVTFDYLWLCMETGEIVGMCGDSDNDSDALR